MMALRNDPVFDAACFIEFVVIDFVVTGIEFYGWLFRCITGRMRYDD